jgi:tetratricopeptide (TPR) repeat protein
MKKVYKILTVFFLAFFISTGCGEDWLELELTGVKPYAAEDIDTEAEAFEFLMAAYDLLQVNYYRTTWSSYYLIGNLPSDDAVPVGGGLDDRPEFWQLHYFETTSDNVALKEFWARNYYGIHRANVVINEIAYKSDRFIAEALFLRAYYYFEVARAFGNAVFYTENLAPDFKPTNTDRSVIYAQCIADLEAAIPYLPLRSQQSIDERSRASKGAAQALLGKVYLYTEDFDNAATALDAVITSGEYNLSTPYDSIFRVNYEYSDESVFEIPYMSYSHGDFWNTNGRESEGNVIAKLTGTRQQAVGEYIDGWGFDMIDSSLVDAWDGANDTVRKYATGIGPEYFLQYPEIIPYTLVKDPDTGEVIDTIYEDENLNGYPDKKENEGFTGWYQIKRGLYAGYNDPNIEPDQTWTNNERMIRYSDVLLMAAEAHNRKSAADDGTAVGYVNQVRNRVGLGPLSSSGAQLFADIKLERRLELAMEGHRFYDLVRWGDAPTVLGSAGFVEGTHEVFPIPATEIGLTELVQNNGY